MLNPKKAKDLISEVANELQLSETLVNDIIIYYWQEVRRSLSGLKNSRIHITNLGDFVVKHWKIKDKIQALESWEETNKQKGLHQITARFKTAETLFDFKNVSS